MSDSTASMSETSLCASQPNCDAEDVAKIRRDDDRDLTNSSSSADDVTAQTDDDSHYVTWTVYVALAIPQGEETPGPQASRTTLKTWKNASPVKTPKADSCYHIECNLLPGDTETTKVDLVLFGPVAKMYRGIESKKVKTWQEGGRRWLGWVQSFNTSVDKDMLVSLLPHKIRLQIWNHSNEFSSQVWRRRLKTSWLSQDESEDTADVYGDVETMVKKMRSVCENRPSTCGKHRETNSETVKKSDSSGAEDVTKAGSALVEISPVCFLAGETSLTDSFPVCSAGVFEVMCNISLDKPLLSEQLKAELNPMVITISSASSMPSCPVPFHVLQERCTPVYCQYKFHHLNIHRTNHHKHSAKIRFRDVNVILTGLMSPEELQEFICGPPMEIEVHDRDLKFKKSPKTGARPVNDTQYGPASFKPKATGLNHYGVAFLDLSELLFAPSIKISLPIKCIPPPPLLVREQRKMAETAAYRQLVPPGHYYEANSQLKVKVDMACPLSGCERPFGRIVYFIGHNNSAMVMKLRCEVLKINAAAFHLDARSLENTETASSNSQDLDFISGFHVLDKTRHIFVLEGLKDKAVKKLWETVSMKLSENEDEQVIVLYNSGLGFFKRIYEPLPVSLSPVRLQEPLDSIMRKPAIYIQGAIPELCFQALLRLSQLSKTRHFRDALQSNLFPSADMILSLRNLYGRHDETWKQTAETNTEEATGSQLVRTKTRMLLNTYNSEYVRWTRTRLQTSIQQNFLQKNKEKVRERSEQLQKTKAAVLRLDQDAAAPVHIYSIQTFNSKVLLTKLLQKETAKMPGRRWTYSQRYLSATVEPGDVAPTSHPASIGWVTDLSSSRTHPKHPHEARVEELRKPWRENVLHANILKPTLPRDLWPWNQRSEDFQLYKKPAAFFSAAPIGIDPAGDALQQDQVQAARAPSHRWQGKQPAGSWSSSSVEILQFRCHMRGKSDRSQAFLKDEPQKYSLRTPGLMLEPTPPLSVRNLGNAEEKLRAAPAAGQSQTLPPVQQTPPHDICSAELLPVQADRVATE